MTIVDLTLRGLSPGNYWATVRETGDISRGAVSAGALWRGSQSKADTSKPEPPRIRSRGVFGVIDVGKDGLGSVFLDTPLQIWEIIGRSIVVSRQHDGERRFERDDADTVVGVIARSAGVWENDKIVCSCSGKTLWEERQDERKKGMR